MQNMRELLIEFEEQFPDLEPETEKYDFIFQMYLTRYAGQDSEPDSLIEDFFEDVFGTLRKKECIWAMASLGANSYNFFYENIHTAVRELGALSKENVNLYFSPAIFTGWRKDQNVSRIRTIYIDIDDIDGMDFSEMDETEIKNFLLETFHLPKTLLPNWLVSSGHGLHLYYLVDEIDLQTEYGAQQRLKYTDFLIAYFGADIACRNKSRILRFPNSKNVKDMEHIRHTRLFHLNPSINRNIDRLDWFQCSEDEIKTYMNECKARRAEKRKQTMIKNGTWREKKEKAPEPKENVRRKKTASVSKPKENKKADTTPLTISGKEEARKEPSHPELKIKNFQMEKKARYTRILNDLHNYAARRKGCPVGFRSIFVHIMSVYLKKIFMPEEQAVLYVKQYIDYEFEPEAAEIVKSVYHANHDYQYTNERIAELLSFTKTDLKYSYACYTEEQREQARKQNIRLYDEKRYQHSREETAFEKQKRKEYIKNHFNEKNGELAKKLGCSVRTVQYIRAGLRKEDTGTFGK